MTFALNIILEEKKIQKNVLRDKSSITSTCIISRSKMSLLFKSIFKNGGIICQRKQQFNFAFFHTTAKNFRSEEPFILKSKFEDVPLSKDTFGDFMWANANKYPTRTALVSFLFKFHLKTLSGYKTFYYATVLWIR